MMFAPGDGTKKWLALATTLVTFVVSLLLWTNWQQGEAGMQFVEDAVWFAPLGIRYTLGVDGISLFLVLLTTFLTPIAVYFSILYVDKRIGPYMALMLLLETAMIGVFLALDLVLFFVFFEAKMCIRDRIFTELGAAVHNLAPTTATIICLLLLLGATGKSAQLPLYIWLPDAMAGPTPVSAPVSYTHLDVYKRQDLLAEHFARRTCRRAAAGGAARRAAAGAAAKDGRNNNLLIA